MALLSHRPPPSADRVDCKGGGVVIGADADPPDIVGDVVDAIRYSTAQLGVDEIVDVDELGRSIAPPFPAVVLEIAYQFLLFCINRNDRFVRRQKCFGLRIDVMKLRVAIDVLAAFSCLAVRLQAIAHAAQKVTDDRRADLVSLVRQLVREITQAAGHPQQRLHRIAARHGLDQPLEVDHKSWILNRLLLASTARLADASARNRRLVTNVGKSVINRRPCQSADPGHQADPAASQRSRLQCDKATTALFIQNRGHLPIAFACGPRLSRQNHPETLRRATHPRESGQHNLLDLRYL